MADYKYMRALPKRDLRAFSKAEMDAVLTYDPETGVFRWLQAIMCARGIRPPLSEAGSPNDSGYTLIKLYGRLYRAHHLAWLTMTGDWPPREGDIDHEDRCRSNNAWSNLRAATRGQNNVNAKIRKSNKSGYKGVSWRAEINRWHARITVGGKILLLGNFERIEDAAEARKIAELAHYPTFTTHKAPK